jgi:hypothetical protein
MWFPSFLHRVTALLYNPNSSFASIGPRYMRKKWTNIGLINMSMYFHSYPNCSTGSDVGILFVSSCSASSIVFTF